MSRRPGQRDVLYEGGPALKELIETYATMDIKAFCAKWDLAIATVRSTASRRGLLRLRVKVPKRTPPTRREELNCVPVPYPFCLQSDLRFTKEADKTPAESHKPVKHDKNR